MWHVTSSYEGDNFVLDQQVVRAALKTLRNLFSTGKPDPSSLSPSSRYLRLLVPPASSPAFTLSVEQWADPATCSLLLEWRAALLVSELAKNIKDMDASVYQRVSKAVSETFVGRQVVEMIGELETTFGGGLAEKTVLRKLYTLVSSSLCFSKSGPLMVYVCVCSIC